MVKINWIRFNIIKYFLFQPFFEAIWPIFDHFQSIIDPFFVCFALLYFHFSLFQLLKVELTISVEFAMNNNELRINVKVELIHSKLNETKWPIPPICEPISETNFKPIFPTSTWLNQNHQFNQNLNQFHPNFKHLQRKWMKFNRF